MVSASRHLFRVHHKATISERLKDPCSKTFATSVRLTPIIQGKRASSANELIAEHGGDARATVIALFRAALSAFAAAA